MGYQSPYYLPWQERTISGQIKWVPSPGVKEFAEEGFYTNRDEKNYGVHLSINGINPVDLRIMADHLEIQRKKMGVLCGTADTPSIMERLATALVNTLGDKDLQQIRELTGLSDRVCTEIAMAKEEAENLISGL